VGVPERGEPGLVSIERDFLRMPSCQINFMIDGLALGVATPIAEHTYVSSSTWRNRQSAKSIRAVNRWPT
jgi:hypothetical protein